MARRGMVIRGAGLVVGITAALLAPRVAQSDYAIVLLNQALMFSVVVLGLNFIYGFGGILSLAQAAFWGIGAYTSAILTVDHGLPVVVGFVAAGVVAAAFGLLIGVPTLRLRSHYLAMATLGFGVAVQMVLMNYTPLTHGAEGIRNIPPASLGPWALSDAGASYYLNLAVVALVVVGTLRFRRSRFGRALEATRDDELAAGATGVNITFIRVLAFALSASIAGLGGSLWAHYFAFIAPETFELMTSIRFIAMLLIGGSGTVAGPILGAFALTYLPEWLRFLKDYYMAIYGLSIAAILIVAPAGVAGLLRRLWESRRVRALRLRLALDDAAEVRPPASPEEAAA